MVALKNALHERSAETDSERLFEESKNKRECHQGRKGKKNKDTALQTQQTKRVDKL
jgi:hypothetical protein